MSVNRPTVPAQKEADINRKLQLYGIFEAFGNGKVPSNTQIDVALNSFLASRHLAKPNPKLSAEGRSLLQDFRGVVEQAKILLLTKNEGNLLQDFIWQCQVAGTGNASSPNAPVGKDTAKQQANQAIDGLRTLGTLIISNGQFRKLLSDVQVLARDIAGDAAQKAANRVNPSEDQLKNIDEPEDDDTWHDTPDAPDVGGMKDQLKNKVKSNKPFGREGMKEAANEAQQAGNQQGGGAVSKAMAAAKTGAKSLRSKGEENTDDGDREKAQEKKEQVKEKGRVARDTTKNYLKEKIPEERREATIYRLKKMIVEIQGHPEYSSAIDTLLSLAEKYQGYSKDLASQATGATKTAHQSDGGITAAEDDLKILIERFANYTSTDDFFDAFNQFYKDADRDPELKGWFKHADVFVRKALKERGWIMEDAATKEWNKLSDQAEHLFRDRYRDHTQRVIDEAKFLGDQFDHDPLNKKLAASMKKLFDDLGTDDNGEQAFKPHLVKDVFNVILPDLFESVRYIPIPRIEYSDPMADAVIENLIIESDNLMPNMIEFGNDNYFRWGRKGVPSRNKNKIMGSVSGIQMDLKDISYFIHKKHGFPSITDTGLMDIFLGGSGFSFKLAMETADHSDNRAFFKVNSVVVDIKNINIKLKKSKYKLMFSLVKPLLLKVMTPILTKVIEKVIKDKIHQMDEFLYGIYKEAQRATNEAKKNPDPENVQNMAKSYFNAAKSKLQEKQAAAKDKSADKTVNIAVTKQDSLFKNISLPGGISTKATEYKNIAAQGKKWESPIFTIGSAGQTKTLPPTQTIKRRPHETAPSQIRGAQNIGKGMGAYSKKDESDIFNESDKYGQTGHYGGERGNTGGKAATSGSQGYSSSTSQGYGSSTAQGYGSSTTRTGADAAYDSQGYGQSANYDSQYASQGAGYGDQYASQGVGYAQTDKYETGDYPTNGNAAYSQTYPAGYPPASSGYADDTLGTATSGYETSRTGATSGTTGAGYGASSPTLSTGDRGTTLGLSNPVLSGRV